MKKLIDINSEDAIIEYDLSAKTKPDDNNMVEASYKVKCIKKYSKVYDENGSYTIRLDVIQREEILKMYRNLEEIENIPDQKINYSSIYDDLPW